MRLFGPMIVLMLTEIALFVTVGGRIGLAASLAVIFGTGLLGGAVLRLTGQQLAAGLRMARGSGAALGAQALLGLAGVLLILPGFLGDLMGLVLLLPPVRTLVVALIARRMPAAETMEFDLQAQRRRGDVVIDGEFIELDPDAPPLPRQRPSGWTRD